MKLRRITALIMVGAALVLTGCDNNNISANDAELLAHGNTNGNINNKGSLCAYEDYIYYANGEDELKLYREKSDGTDEEKISDGAAYFINVHNDKVYYTDENDGFSVYSANLDGSDNQKIIEAPANYMTIYDDNIYYSNADDNGYIYKASLDGKTNEKLIEVNAFYLTVYKGFIYYVNANDGAKVYRASTDGSNNKVIIDDYTAYINVYNDYIYYTTPPNQKTGEGQDTIHKFSLEDHSTEEIVRVSAQDINVVNDRIYFQSIGDAKIYSCDLNGQDLKEEADEQGMYINVAGNRMSYVISTDDDASFQLKTKEIN